MRQKQLYILPHMQAVLRLPAPSWEVQGKETEDRLAPSKDLGAQQETLQTTRAPTPIKLCGLKNLLHFYPKREVAHRLASGFEFGFRIPALAPSHPTWAKNLCSILGMEDVVCRKIEKEIRAGWVIGPCRELSLKNLRVSPLGLVPKKAPGEFHLIHHLSFPRGDPLNDGIL